MKGIFIVLDGIGDLPNKTLNDKTPLEAAKTPNLDVLSARSEMGFFYPVKPGFIPESDEAIISMFGNEQYESTRGQLEAKGSGLNVDNGDLTLRANFATINGLEKGQGVIVDRRAGRTLTTEEAEILSEALNEKIKLSVPFDFKTTIQHRGVLVFRGGFSDIVSNVDSSYYEKGQLKFKDTVHFSQPLDDDENSQYSANVINEFLRQAYEILNEHPINKERKRKGLMSANFILLRGPGVKVPKLKLYRKWMSIAYMPLEIGFSQLSGMDVFSFSYPEMKSMDVYKNLNEGLKKTCKFSIKALKKNRNEYDYVYLHIKETDVPGHDNKPLEKKEMIEYIDKTLFRFLVKFASSNGVKILITGDHSTPCKLKAHSADPVPVMLYNPHESIPKEKHFSEKEARRGTLGRIVGGELFKKTGFDK